MYLITYIANVLNIVPTFQSYGILLLALFLDIEFLHDKFKKIIINSFPEKLLDFLYIMITHYSLIFFSAALFLSSDWILNCFVNTVKIILMIISCIFIYLGCKNSASEKFKIASFDEIKEKIDNMRGYWFRGLVSAPLAEFILNNITGVEFKIPNPESCLLGIVFL